MTGILHRYLAHPLTRDKNIDDPQTTFLRSEIIRKKPFLEKIYTEWYGRISAHFAPESTVLELGAGAGFLRECMPGVICSEVFLTPGIDLVSDARAIALGDKSLDGIVMTDVLHHIPDCRAFFYEAARVVRPGGKIIMIEPWVTPWSGWVYTHLHHEPFEPDAENWHLPADGPLSCANGALPWIIFHRDRHLFEQDCPFWHIEAVVRMMPIAYLVSGGISLRNILPGWMYRPIRLFERYCREDRWAMFAEISLGRVP